MSRRIKKPLVKPLQRREWLRRFEEDGQSSAEIAKADGYDVRTVRKQLELTRQEREGREAHAMVLRQALERHYEDLVAYAQKLDAEVAGWSLLPGTKSHRVWLALREHLPRSPLWKALDRMERLNEEVQDIRKRTEQRLRDKVKERSSLDLVSKPGEPGLYDGGLVKSMNHHLLGASPGPLLGFRRSSIREGLMMVYYGAFPCAADSPEQVPNVEELIAGLMTELSGWPEYEELRRALEERVRASEAAREELATIMLRRIVPGRCRYCPA